MSIILPLLVPSARSSPMKGPRAYIPEWLALLLGSPPPTMPTFIGSRIPSLEQPQSPLSTPAELVLGAVAGALTQILTIPIAVLTTR